MIIPNKDTDIVKKAQAIIDNYVMFKINEPPHKMSKVDTFLWVSAAITVCLTLTLYFIAK